MSLFKDRVRTYIRWDHSLRRAVTLMTAVWCLLGAGLPGWADTITVPYDYSTIQAAIDAASSGDEVMIYDGTYTIHNYNGSTFTITHSDVEGGWTGTGNIDSDPFFVDVAVNDFHILWGSPCRDSGDNSSVLDDYDMDGGDRIANGITDMGVDEFENRFYLTGSFYPGTLVTIHFVGTPGAMTGLFIGSDLLNPPLKHPWGDFYMMAPWVLVLLAPIPSNGHLTITELIPTTPAGPYSVPMQGLIQTGSACRFTDYFMLEVK